MMTKILTLLIFSSSMACAQLIVNVDMEATIDNSEVGLETRFEMWKTFHSKMYESEEIEEKALLAFVENDEIILKHNLDPSTTFTLGHNVYSDLTWSEFKTKYVSGLSAVDSLRLRGRKNYDHTLLVNTSIPEEVDWVAAGAVTGVKNQEQCGSCWAFSTTGSLEGALFVAEKKLISLSEQQLVSCDKVDDGCQGGLMDNGFEFVMKNNGICSEDSYPYVSGDGDAPSCKTKCSDVMTITGYSDVPVDDENELKKAVAQQPVSIAIEADKSKFQLYKSGVFTSSSCGTDLDHGVLAVGYGTNDEGTKYWMVKNSWGESWGMNGYIKMQRDISSKHGMCGIAMQASYPTGASSLPTTVFTTSSDNNSPKSGKKTHYGDPSSGCKTDEVAIRLEGVDGDICSPPCDGTTCPTDEPEGTTANPVCLFEDSSSGKKYCGLQCTPSVSSLSDECGKNASCKSISGVGICTYNQ